MFEQILEIDSALFLFLNGLHVEWLDEIMYQISEKFEWKYLYLFLFILLVKEYKWKVISLLLILTLIILITDQLTSSFMKPFFGRLRPTHTPAIQNIVHTVNEYRGGQFSFASSHAANVFGLSTFLWFVLKKRYKWIVWIFLWAVLVSYSRIYLGVHYPGDIIVGAIIGVVTASAMYHLYMRVIKKLVPGFENYHIFALFCLMFVDFSYLVDFWYL